jgi:hypothetical protein
MAARYGLRVPAAGAPAWSALLDRNLPDPVRIENKPLSEVAQWLTDQSRAIDPAGKGARFIVNRADRIAYSSRPEASLPTERALDSCAISIEPPLENVTLREVLDAITKTGSIPLAYTSESYGIVFRIAQTAPTPMGDVPEPSSQSMYVMNPALAARYGLRVMPAPAARQPEPGTHNAHELEQRLDKIRISLDPIDDKPLSDVAALLRRKAAEADSKGPPLNFLFSAMLGAPDMDAAMRLHSQEGPLAKTKVRLDGSIPNVSLREALGIILQSADAPLDYVVDRYAIYFAPDYQTARRRVRIHGSSAAPVPRPASASNPAPPAPAALQARTFQVDTNQFLTGLERAFGIRVPAPDPGMPDGADRRVARAEELQSALSALLDKLGVGMEASGRSAFYNEANGVLLVRASEEDLETVQAALKTMGAAAPSTTPGYVMSDELRKRYGLPPASSARPASPTGR